MDEKTDAFWSKEQDDLLRSLSSSAEGLTSSSARDKLQTYGANSVGKTKKTGAFLLLLSQFKSPISIILLFAVLLSLFLGDTADALIILVIVLLSGIISFWQEHGANHAVAKLLELVQIKTTVLRDGSPRDIGVEDVVPGDVVLLKAGAVIPADCFLLESESLNVDEATLTGESFPVEKKPGVLKGDTSLGERTNSLWMGTHVISGTAKALVVRTGKETEFGAISGRLKLRPPETEFDKGIRNFGYFLMEITLLLVILIFAFNVFFQRPVLDSFLFSLALAVGLTPQLLPAIIGINLSHGAKNMAKHKVIVKRLASIENFGSMDVLCSDKTGTLTDGTVKVSSAVDVSGAESDKVLLYAFLNASFESGFLNPIDAAIRTHRTFETSGYQKLDEHPYDFIRKRLSIMLTLPDGDSSGKAVMITKGALSNVLAVCAKAEVAPGNVVDLQTVSGSIERQFEEFSAKGLRTLGIAYKNIHKESTIEDELEQDMTFLGLITFFDPLKENIIETIRDLKNLGVSLKIITGDNKLIASNIISQIGIPDAVILTGSDIRTMRDGALIKRVGDVTVFAEVEPNQKERIVTALKKAGHVVGYMGDGINDTSALHVADVSISVDSAVDVAKEAADIVLLEKRLDVLLEGVKAGRVTFNNTLKYVFMATSANFGNMFSMAGASLFLPFLPLLPKQILLTNLLTDLPEMTIASDAVDSELVSKPRRWDIGFIRRFMLTFGLISSVFDYITFGVLMFAFGGTEGIFRTGWFLESVISASLIVLVIRSRKPFWASKPGRWLVLATLCVIAAALLLPYSPLSGLLGFEPVCPFVLAALSVIVVLYILTAELAKKLFYRSFKNKS